MLSPVVVLSGVVVTLGLIAINVAILLAFQHEDDKNQALVPKVVVVAGLTLAEVLVLMLPFDVAVSSAGATHRENMAIVWQVVFMLLVFVLVVAVPFALYFYEGQDPEAPSTASQVWHAVQVSACTIAVALLSVLVLYFFLGTAEVPVATYTTTFERSRSGGSSSSLAPISLECRPDDKAMQCTGSTVLLELDVGVPVYLTGLLSFVGWFFFVVFAGVGMVALPLDLCSQFYHRPQHMSDDEFQALKLDLNQRARKLKLVGDRIHRQGGGVDASRRNTKLHHSFRRAAYFLENDWRRLKDARDTEAGTLKYWGFLLLSLVTGALSLCWLVHVVLFMLLDAEHRNPFLNNMFLHLDHSFPFVGTVFYGVFSFYLVWATIQGNFKLGLRFEYFAIHPMKLNGTMMNSFLFNTALTLLCSLPIVQFCARAFALYAHDSAVEQLLTIQVTNTRVFRFFFVNDLFLFALFAVCALAFVGFLVWPSDSGKPSRTNRASPNAYAPQKDDDEENWAL